MDYPNDRMLTKAQKTSHAGLDAARFLPVLEWLEERWSRHEPEIALELQPDRRSFEDWLLALMQGFGDMVIMRGGPVLETTTGALIRHHTRLSSLADLVASRVCDVGVLHMQLIAAWLWAQGHTEASRIRLHKVQKLTGYTDTQIKNILKEAEPARLALGQSTRRRDLWRMRDPCQLWLGHAPADEASGSKIEQALRVREEGLALVRLGVARADLLADAIRAASAGDMFVILWSAASSILWSSGASIAEVMDVAARSRVFLLFGALDGEPGPHELPDRDTVKLSADTGGGVEAILRIWRSARAAEQRSGRQIAPTRYAATRSPEGVTIYVTSTHGDVYVPINVHLADPAGVLVTRLVEDWRLPTTFEILGRPTHTIQYVLFYEEQVLAMRQPLSKQGVSAGSLLELGFIYEETGGGGSRIGGYLRSGNEETLSIYWYKQIEPARPRTSGHFRGGEEATLGSQPDDGARELVEAALIEAGLIPPKKPSP